MVDELFTIITNVVKWVLGRPLWAAVVATLLIIYLIWKLDKWLKE